MNNDWTNHIQQIAKIMMMAGSALFTLGVVIYFTSKLTGIGRLPGDFLIKKGNGTFYFPMMTCLLLSGVLSIVSYLINVLKK